MKHTPFKQLRMSWGALISKVVFVPHIYTFETLDNVMSMLYYNKDVLYTNQNVWSLYSLMQLCIDVILVKLIAYSYIHSTDMLCLPEKIIITLIITHIIIQINYNPCRFLDSLLCWLQQLTNCKQAEVRWTWLFSLKNLWQHRIACWSKNTIITIIIHDCHVLFCQNCFIL